MPTQNRRVAAYLPSHIDACIKTFKSDRQIKGDSEALIAILSEYFQVSQEVAYPSSSNLLQRIEAIEEKLGSLKSELLSELKSELQPLTQLKSDKKESKLSSELQGELPVENENSSSKSKLSSKSKKLVPQATPLFPEARVSDLPSELKSNALQINPMNGSDLSRRFGLDRNTVAKTKNSYKGNPEKFSEWTKAKDPDGIAWEYNEANKLYHPVQSLDPSQGRGAEQSGVANP